MGDIFRLRTNGSKPAATKAPHAKSGLIAALDVGSSKVACLIARADSGTIKVLGSALHESHGVRSGTVTSLEQADRSIRKAVDAAEQLADHRIQDVILAVQGGQPKSLNARAECALNGALVDDMHLRSLLADAKHRCREDGYETIQAAPTAYVVDQSRGVADPRGMFCDRLGASVHAVAMRSGPLYNLRMAVQRCHLGIARQLYSGYASGLATLTADEMSLGVTLIDMGAGCTSVAIFAEDALVHVESVPLGGAHVTADVARLLSTPLSAAERIKSLYGSCFGEMEAGGDLVEVPLMGEEREQGSERVRRSKLTGIIHARMEEIFSELQSRLAKGGFDVAAGRRAVLTGGASQLAGARELATRVLGKQVRLGKPLSLPGLAAATAGPAYATALGLLIAGATSQAEMNDPNPPHATTKVERKGGIGRWLSASLFG
jgi:cell division protein FtsA